MQAADVHLAAATATGNRYLPGNRILRAFIIRYRQRYVITAAGGVRMSWVLGRAAAAVAEVPGVGKNDAARIAAGVVESRCQFIGGEVEIGRRRIVGRAAPVRNHDVAAADRRRIGRPWPGH